MRLRGCEGLGTQTKVSVPASTPQPESNNAAIPPAQTALCETALRTFASVIGSVAGRERTQYMTFPSHPSAGAPRAALAATGPCIVENLASGGR
jgi:hypothetical protein